MHPVPPSSPTEFEPNAVRTQLIDWFQQTARELPWRQDPSPYAVLVSELMLQQTQVRTVLPYFEKWMRRFPSLQSLAEAPETEVLQHWEGLGYYSRARNLHRAAQILVRDWQGQIPSEPQQLQSLPGVGRYTAGAIAAFAFDRSVPAVDGNIARVLARLSDLQIPIDRPKGQEALWQVASQLLPPTPTGGRLIVGALMELGALVCSPKKPKCASCPIQSHCRTSLPEDLPRKSPRAKTVLLEESAAWIFENESLLLRPQTGKRARGLWKLPDLLTPPPGEPLWQTIYPFTHHRITLRVFKSNPEGVQAPADRWFSLGNALDAVPLPAPHRRALQALLPTSASFRV
jgi:A/G-specific adenine glycosylase